MNLIYANGGFYPIEDKARFEAAGAWPTNGFEITAAERDDLLDGERAGMRIVADSVGKPMLVVAPNSLPPSPSVVSPRQARLALLQTGRLQAVTAIIEQSDEPTRITWDYATSFERTSPVVQALANALGLSEADLDELFTLAATF